MITPTSSRTAACNAQKAARTINLDELRLIISDPSGLARMTIAHVSKITHDHAPIELGLVQDGGASLPDAASYDISTMDREQIARVLIDCICNLGVEVLVSGRYEGA